MLSPVRFQEKFLKRKLWGKQREMVTAAATKRSVSVKGCHGSGKTFAGSGIVPYELLAYEESIVLVIAPTLRQVKTFWNEIAAAISVVQSKVNVPDPSTTGWQLSDKCYALGFSSSKGVNAQGFHGRRVTILADEAVGSGPDIWDAVEGIRAAGDVRMIKFCNPTVPSGAPFEDFTRLRGSTECITISAFDTPNLEGLTIESLLQLPDEQLDYAPFPWLTRRRWVKEMYFKWGPTNPRFMSRVLGEFPTQSSDTVFSLAWIERAALPYDEQEFAKECRANRERLFVQVGLDIAGPGDDETSVYARIGPYVVGFESWSKADPLNEVLMFLGNLAGRYQCPVIVMADVVGIGYHFARAIARNGHDVREFRAGAQPVDTVMFANAKAEAYWRTRECMQSGDVRGVIDEDTKAQLSDVRYRELANSKIEIEHKDEARARGSSSPDRAEALIMAFARIVPKERSFEFPQYEISQY